MTTSQIITSINDSQKLLQKLNLLEAFSYPSLLKPDKTKYRRKSIEDSKYEENFLFGLENQYYNFILKDYSYFQFDFDEAEDLRNGYTNPFENLNEDLGTIQSLYDEGEIDFEEYSQAMSEAKPLSKKVPIRYDLSFKQYKKIYHPTSHFHFGIAENSRIPTDKLFTPLLFTKFILNMYYITYWEEGNDEQYSLDNAYRNKLNSCKKIRDFNGEEVQYICDLEENLLNIK